MKLRITIFIIFFFGLFNSNFIKGEILQIHSDGEETLDYKSSKNIGTNYLTDFVTNPYIIGPGDSILISVSPDYLELLRTVTINGEGTVNLPILKKVYIEGLTLEELDSLLNEKYSKYLKFPEVESSILFYRPVSVMIDGGVKVLKGPIKYLTFNNNAPPEKSTFSYSKNSRRGSITNPHLKRGRLEYGR